MTGAGSAANGRFCCVAVLAVGLVIGAGSQAQAARYYWSDGEPDFYRPDPRPSPRRHKAKQGQAPKTAKPEREAAKPQGPLIIAVSIGQQRLKIYDANGVFAESPVSTGMRGHATPMGVFSVIQKHKLHHSNIYSNAPMPYMQRITWSGVALHAGVLPDYPASHGCIRMPMAFAVKMWNWTRMGARVVVAPGELTPATFAHALLPAQKLAPQPVAAAAPDADKPVVATAGKSGLESTSAKPQSAIVESATIKAAGAAGVGTDLALRTSLGHDDRGKTSNASTPLLRDQTHTADAGGDGKAGRVTMSDASSGSSEPQHDDGAPKSESVTSDPIDARREAGNEATSEAKADDVTKAAKTDTTADAAETTAKSEAAKSEAAKSETTRSETAKSETAKSEAIKPVAKPVETKTDAAGIDAAKDKDQTHLPDTAKDPAKDAPKAAAVKTDPPRRAGQIAVFISRKDSKIYVRQNFAPLFEAPVTIAASERPLGTHIFTADVDRKDANALHWSVVTLPVSVRSAARSDDERDTRRRKTAAAAQAKPVAASDTPAEALDRITIAADTMARVSEALTSGGSIIVSDQGINQGETGEGTDFIVSLR